MRDHVCVVVFSGMWDGMKFEGGTRDCKGSAGGGKLVILMAGQGNY